MATDSKNEMEEKLDFVEKTQTIISKESVMKNLTNTKDGYSSLLVKNIFNGSNDYSYQKSTVEDSKILKNIDESHLFLKINNGRLLSSLASEDENMDICISSGNEKNVLNKTQTRVIFQQQIVGSKPLIVGVGSKPLIVGVGSKPLIVGDSTAIEKKNQDEKKRTDNIIVNNQYKNILKNKPNIKCIPNRNLKTYSRVQPETSKNKPNIKCIPNSNLKTYNRVQPETSKNKFKKTHLIPYKKKYFSKTQSLARKIEINCNSEWPLQSQESFQPQNVRTKQPIYVEGQQYILQDGCPDFCLFDLLKSFASDDDSDIEDLSHDQTVLTFASTEVKLLKVQDQKSKPNTIDNKNNTATVLAENPSSVINIKLINNPSTSSSKDIITFDKTTNEKSNTSKSNVSDYIRMLNSELLTNSTHEKISQFLTKARLNTAESNEIYNESSREILDTEFWNHFSSKFPSYKSASDANHAKLIPKNIMQNQAPRTISINITNNNSALTPNSVQEKSNFKQSVTLATLEIQSGKDLMLTCTICNDNFVLIDAFKCMSDNNKEKLEIKFTVYCFIYSDNGQQKKLHIFGRNFPCKICREACSSEPELYCHMKGHSFNSFIQCPFCTYNCNRQGFRHHVSRHFPRFKCPLCGIGYNLAQQFHSHLTNHTILKLYSCEFCSEKFNQIETLFLHLHVIHPYIVQCPLCTLKFFSFTDLENHRSTHVQL